MRQLLTDPIEIEILARRIEELPPTAVVYQDTETTGLYPWAGDKMTGHSICIVDGPGKAFPEPDSWYLPVDHGAGNAAPRAIRRLWQALSRTQAVAGWHHAPFDWTMLEKEDESYRHVGRYVDTQVVRWVQDENAAKGLKKVGWELLGEDADEEQRELKALMAAPYRTVTDARKAVLEAFPELGYYKVKGQQLPYDDPSVLAGKVRRVLHPGPEAERLAQQLKLPRTWGSLTPAEIGHYAARDASLTAQIAELLLGHAKIIKLPDYLQREHDVQSVVWRMEHRGITANRELIVAARDKYASRAEEIATEFHELYGIENLGSPDQVADLVYHKLGQPQHYETKSGKPATNKNALELMEGHPQVAKVLEYRRMRKAVTSYCDPYLHFLETGDGETIHSHFSSVGTVTGRLSASGPNLMTIPRKSSLPELRAAFAEASDPGLERVGFDINSAELWVTASITGDEYLSTVLSEGRDLHTETADFLFHDHSEKWRTLAKNVNYGIAYEAGVDQITMYAAKAGLQGKAARRMAYEIRDGHIKLFPQMHHMSKYLAEVAERDGYVPMFWPGRALHFDTPHPVRPRFAYTAMNGLIQGGVAEVVKDVMLNLEEYEQYLRLQVHDELAFDLPPELVAPLHKHIQQVTDDLSPFRVFGKPCITWDPKAWRATV